MAILHTVTVWQSANPDTTTLFNFDDEKQATLFIKLIGKYRTDLDAALAEPRALWSDAPRAINALNVLMPKTGE